MRRDLGDFQTPPALVAEVLDVLGPVGGRWPRVLEPTCGRGHFIAGLLGRESPPREIHGIEIQEAHHQAACEVVAATGAKGTHVQITRADIFGIDVGRDLRWRQRGPLLVVGNPPWVTNSELGSLASIHRAPRRNLKGLRGLEARTGSSNFDLTEAIWIKLALELLDEQPTIALLCKTSVARSLLEFAHGSGLPIASASIRRIDAARWFRAAVDACLFCVTLGPAPAPVPPLMEGGVGGVDPARPITNRQTVGLPQARLKTDRNTVGLAPTHPRVPIYSTLSASHPDSVMGFARGRPVADADAHERWAFADGTCPLHWRQGLKHDAAAVMELIRDVAGGQWRNRGGERVDVEADFVYPLVKGTDLTRKPADRPQRATLVTQKFLGEATEPLADLAPRLWSYLTLHASIFTDRKSSIYRGKPCFSLFGIGPYSFAPYKVAICGMHKAPKFCAIGPVLGRPVMLDDTCYFLPCLSAEEASIVTALFNDPISLGLLNSLIFLDAKRPITKKVLERVDCLAVLRTTDRDALLARATAVQRDELMSLPNEPLVNVVERLEQSLAEGSQAPQAASTSF